MAVVELQILNENAVEATLLIRIPGWARNEPVPSDLFSVCRYDEAGIPHCW